MSTRSSTIFMAMFLSAFASVHGQVSDPAAHQNNQQPVYEPSVPAASNIYPLGKDSLPDPAVRKGKSFQFQIASSKIYPGTKRTITVYVPAAYTGEKPACVYVGLEG